MLFRSHADMKENSIKGLATQAEGNEAEEAIKNLISFVENNFDEDKKDLS